MRYFIGRCTGIVNANQRTEIRRRRAEGRGQKTDKKGFRCQVSGVSGAAGRCAANLINKRA